MTFSDQTTKESYRLLKECVLSAMRVVNPSLERIGGDAQFLLVSTDADFAGFVLLNGNPEATYQRTYDKFKETYRAKHDQAASKTLSFVLCRTDTDVLDDLFYGEVESDVYFCRKYIITYRETRPLLLLELNALPFLPLPEGEAAGIQRPPSAQTLLHSLGLSSSLVRKIIVPREHSARRIVDNILDGSIVLPDLKAVSSTKATSVVARLPSPTRVSSLNIEAFRAYRGQQDFDLDADITVLYGPNGSGKTSFFDAIDYVCTGRIERFCRHRIAPEKFAEIVRNLDCPSDVGEVCLGIRRNSQSSKIVRTVNDWGHAQVDGIKYDRSGLLQHLSSARWQDRAPRVENLERLFRATHLFSQTDPQLMSVFLTDSAIPFELISRMLALDDYASGLQKVEGISQLVSAELTTMASELQSLKEEASELENKIRGYQRAEVKGTPALIAGLIEEVQSALAVKHADIAQEKPTADVVRGWRSLVDGNLDEWSQRIQLAKALSTRLPEIAAARKALELTDKRIGEVATQLALKSTALASAQNDLQIAQARYDAARKELAEVEAAGDLYKQCTAASEKLGLTTAKKIQQEADIQELRKKSGTTQLGLKKADSAQKVAAEQLATVAAAVQAAKEKAESFRGLVDQIPSWNDHRAALAQLTSQLDTLRGGVRDIQSDLEQLKSELSPMEKRLADVSEQYEVVSKDQDELTQLLDRVETHVRASICPLCGTEHHSEQLLLEHIRTQKARRPQQVEKLAEEKTSLTKQVADLRDRLIKLKTEASRAAERHSSKLKKTRDTSSSVDLFEDCARAAGFEPEAPDFPDILVKAGQSTHGKFKRLQKDQGRLKARVEELTAPTNAQQQRLDSLTVKIAEAEKAAAVLDAEEDSCRVVFLDAGLSPDATMTDVAERADEIEKRKKKITTEMQKVAEAVGSAKSAMSKIQIEHATLMKKRLELQTTQQEQRTAVDQHKYQLSQLGFDLSATQDHLNRFVDGLEIERERLDNLVSRVRFLETTLDSAAKSAVESEAASILNGVKKQIKKIREDIAALIKAGKLFAKITENLKLHAASAIDEHIAAYGPLTTIIQKRLRAVYGFGDIRLRTKGDSIRVEVDRGDNTLRPIDYFSDSEKQILMLSIFLAGRLTQTWSGFAPILMDDPVTHFDDLNAYAFVELLRGILQSPQGGRQFIISTCEERLFGLMREKFADIAGGSRFYQLQCMTRNGPRVERLG